jgi:hypothetical protein
MKRFLAAETELPFASGPEANQYTDKAHNLPSS